MKPRPKIDDDNILEVVALQLANKVKEWLEDDYWSIDDIIQNIKYAIRLNNDGYDIAKAFDDMGTDAELVSIFNQTASLKYDAVRQACISWVNDNNLTGPAIGTTVRFIANACRHQGVVIENSLDGKSSVYCEELGKHKIVLSWEVLMIN